ncbi:MAG: hypothetical protein IJ737_07545 [Ruminococcus sp.]|nr:hypothetical protein [Ruminococcus sp.]
MGFLDKVKDFLDDGKINGSAAKPSDNVTAAAENAMKKAQAAPKPAASPAPAQKAAPAPKEDKIIPAGTRIEIRFGSPSPVPYMAPDGSAFLRYAGSCTVGHKERDYPEKLLKEEVARRINMIMPPILAEYSAQQVTPEKLPACSRQICQKAEERLRDLGYDVENIRLVSLTTA